METATIDPRAEHLREVVAGMDRREVEHERVKAVADAPVHPLTVVTIPDGPEPPFEPTMPNPLRFEADGPKRERQGPKAKPKPWTMTLREYCRTNAIDYDFEYRRAIAIRLLNMAAKAGKEVVKLDDERYGKINSYPKSILDAWKRTLPKRPDPFGWVMPKY